MSRQVSATITVERNEEELEIEVTGYAVPFVRGRYSGPPELCYPDEGGEVEDISASLNGQPFELTETEEETAQERLQEAAADAEEAALEAWAEAEADAMEARDDLFDCDG